MMKKLIAFLTAVTLFISCTVVASAVDKAVTSNIKYYYVGTQQFANAAKVTVSNVSPYNRVFGETRLEVVGSHDFFPIGNLGVSATLYDSTGRVAANAPMTTNGEPAIYVSSNRATVDGTVTQNYYASGYSFVYNGNGYEATPTYDTPSISSRTSTYQINEAGQTYGSELLATTYEDRPDLISAIGTNGAEGFIYASDLDAGNPQNPAEALAQQELYNEMIANYNGDGPIVVRTIPLYDVDGKTVIGEFDISFTPNSSEDLAW